VSIARRQELLLDAFIVRKSKVLAGSQTPFAIFVKKLQESLTRMEAFDVVTVTQGMDGTSMLFSQTNLSLMSTQPLQIQNAVVLLRSSLDSYVCA
jgi:E3 ubiquitin-protein ligase TRIP12